MTQHDTGYLAFRSIRESGSYTTEEGLLIKPYGTANNPLSQGYVLQLGDKSLEFQGFYGPENIFRALDAFAKA